MMRVGDGHRQRVGGVGTGDRRTRKQALDHRVDLRLVGAAGADDRFLDQGRRIFADREAGAGGAHQSDSARVAQLERRLRVLVDEHFLDGSGRGGVLGKQRLELAREVGEPFRERGGGAGLELAVGEVGQAVAVGLDQPPAGRAEPGVEAEDLQASRSSSSSGTS